MLQVKTFLLNMNDFLCMSITNRLKEKGFTFDLLIRYDGNGSYYHSVGPRISQVLDWLRIERNIDIVIYPISNTLFMGGEKYILSIYVNKKREMKIHFNNIDKYVEWEDAVIAGIEYSIENLL